MIFLNASSTQTSCENKQTQKQDIGFIAHELQELYPELVNGLKDGPEIQRVNYIGLIPILINEIKNMKKELKNTDDELKLIDEKLNKMKMQMFEKL